MSKSSFTPDAIVHLIQPGNDQTNPDAQRLWAASKTANSKKSLDTRIVFEDDTVKALVSLGSAGSWAKKSANARRETIRKAAGIGIGKVRDLALSAGVKTVEFHAGGEAADAHAIIVGARLGVDAFTLKTDRDADPGSGTSPALSMSFFPC